MTDIAFEPAGDLTGLVERSRARIACGVRWRRRLCVDGVATAILWSRLVGAVSSDLDHWYSFLSGSRQLFFR
jgi:hypothetical protein